MNRNYNGSLKNYHQTHIHRNSVPNAFHHSYHGSFNSHQQHSTQFTHFPQHHQQNQNHKHSENEQNPGQPKSYPIGLWMLFTLHRITGLSFLGASVPLRPLSLFSKFCLISWNLTVFAFSYYVFYISVSYNDENYKDINDSSFEYRNPHAFFVGHPPLSPLVIYLRIGALAIYHIFSYLINLYLGIIARPFLNLLVTEILPKLNRSTERRIGALIVFLEIIFILILLLVLQTLIYIQNSRFLIIRGFEVGLNMFSLFAPIAFIAYLNLTLAHIIKSGNSSPPDLSQYIERLIQVGSTMRRATRFLGPAIIILIVNSMVVCICTVCLCIANWSNTYPISICGFLAYAMVLVTLVILSSHAYETAKHTSEQYKEKLLLALCVSANKTGFTGASYLGSGTNQPEIDSHLISSQLTILSSLEDNIRMSPLNLFYVTRSYIITFFAFMLSYAVILVQTSKSAILDFNYINDN